ncbi:MAG: DUF3685 domain-containing protein [Synechococcales cyanobacterium C42_A2020_086]|jgi:DNA-binding NarL/FixJ family response regulator|nr:DUF3685 domain-containing protein [Synechococcales cyanobacterium C42_A2020_086]
MNRAVLPALERPPVRLLLVDSDRVFRVGLTLWLEQFTDIAVIAEAESGEVALQRLSHLFADEDTREDTLEAADRSARDVPVNLVLLDLNLGQFDPESMPALTLCQILKSRYPDLPILLLSTSPEPILLAAAQRAGADGCCPKSLEPTALVTVIRRVASGQSCWILDSDLQERSLGAAPRLSDQPEPQAEPPAAVASSPPGALTVLRRNWRVSGLRQIDAALDEVMQELRNPDLSPMNRAIAAGRYRELRTARWIVQRLLATPTLPDPEIASARPDRLPDQGTQEPSVTGPRLDSAREARSTPSYPLVPVSPEPDSSAIVEVNVQALILDAVASKLSTSLENQSDTPLEIDILREDRKQELFYLILRKIEDMLAELRYSQVQPEQLDAKRSLILQDLWQAATVDFFGKYYTVSLGGMDVEVVAVLLQEAATVQTAILDKIPGVVALLHHLLFQTPLLVDSTPYAAGNPESLARAELLLENLMIQLANAVIQPLLNRFPNVEPIKQNFYNRRLLSSREIERFRNDLSWKYRLERLFREPKNIFESQYSLFVFSGRGIKKTAIYAPRTEELQQLTGVPLVVTLALEARDAIAPRVRSVVSLVGNGVVYVLTEVVGRGIGLIGRGILKGLGNAWQDPNRYKGDRAGRGR